MPPAAGRSRRGARIVKFEEQPEGFRRRWTRRLFRPAIVIPLVFLTTIALGLLGYYYYVFSQRIDRLLRGEVFTRSAGIYGAPKEIRVGDNFSAEDLVARLQRVGYVDKAQQADSSRGRYSTNGSVLDVEPSKDATIDGRRQFARLRVQFGKGGRSIAGISNLDDNGAKAQSAWLEPEQITSVAGTEREKRKVVGYKDLPPHLVKAIVATEDRTFFDHHGLNLRGIVRAFVRRYDSDPNSPIARQGGSSITQQLVKNLFLTPEYSLKRKLAEAYMSVIIETRLSKEEIFALYCNEAYLGQRAGYSIKGFGEAAESYFNKDVTSLTLPESALLAALIRSPNRYNPYRHPEVATERRNQVLKDMLATGAINEKEAAQSQAEPLKVVRTKGRIDTSEAPYFIDYAQSQLADVISDTSAAERLRIYTTVDLDLQRAAYAAVTKQLAALDKVQSKRFPPGTLQAALVAMRADTGEVVAMVGGRDYEKSQLNRATDAMRQPGSVFKPFVYAAALNTAYDPIPRVITPATVYIDEPKTFSFGTQEYSPGNFGDQYTNGPVTLRDALVKSLNVITVEVAQEVTVGRVTSIASKAGLPKPKQNYLAHALGTNEATPLQVASAYTAFAQGGRRTAPMAIGRVTTGSGNTVVAPSAQKNEVMTPEVAYVMTSMMKDVVNRGTAAKVRARGFKANVAGKTGTSRDGWFAGYTPSLVCVVYVGFDDNADLGMTGADSALPIWTDFMQAALAAHPEWGGDWQMPANVQQAEIDPKTGKLAPPESVSKRVELFIANTAPVEESVGSEDDTLGEGEEGEGDGVDEPAPPEAIVVPPLDDAPPPRERRPGRQGEDDSERPRLSGLVTLDIDPTTGFIATEACPVRRSKTFPIGEEPRRYCGPEYHTGRVIIPSDSRPRRVSPQ
ncbi:MAG TPA: PBP1A family penicillin-binding protein [Pyrinomonadaceae bacterium]